MVRPFIHDTTMSKLCKIAGEETRVTVIFVMFFEHMLESSAGHFSPDTCAEASIQGSYGT